MKTKSVGVVIVIVMIFLTACTSEPSDSLSGVPESASIQTNMEFEEIDNEVWFLVETEAQLRSIADNDTLLAQNYMQNADIVLTSEWISIGNDKHPFTGKYNGNGHTISGLYYPLGEKKYSGLFGYSKGGEIFHITLVSPDTTNANGTHNGAIVALCRDGGGSHDNAVIDDAPSN